MEVYINNVDVIQYLAAFKVPEEDYLASKGQQVYLAVEEEAYLIDQAYLMPLHSRDLI